jgi:hypothetical protein
VVSVGIKCAIGEDSIEADESRPLADHRIEARRVVAGPAAEVEAKPHVRAQVAQNRELRIVGRLERADSPSVGEKVPAGVMVLESGAVDGRTRSLADHAEMDASSDSLCEKTESSVFFRSRCSALWSVVQ